MTKHEFEEFIRRYEDARLDRRDSLSLRDWQELLPDRNHPDYLSVLSETVRIDMEVSWADEIEKSASDYRDSFPELFEDAIARESVAFEEYRLRQGHGQPVSPGEFASNYNIDTFQWPLNTQNEEPAESNEASDIFEKKRSRQSDSGTSSSVDLEQAPLQVQLQRRLRFVALTFSILLGYLALLVWFNPEVKVGLFLGNYSLVILNVLSFVVCVLIGVVLFVRRGFKLRTLRNFELALFGVMLFELGLGLYSDLFFDHELVEPLQEGNHSLFHYSSSWSLPFFALIIVYGTLIPSTSRRCSIVVAVMSLIPLTICIAAAYNEGGLTQDFFQSFVLQMAIWMGTASVIAVYGVHRIEVLQKKLQGNERIGRYRLKKQIATGGMGQVFLAEHILLQKPCAIKLMRAELAQDQKLFTRFEREVHSLAGISHPNVVEVYDFGRSDDGAFYYVMEYLKGGNLSHTIQHAGTFSEDDVRQVIQQLCSALGALHQNGLIHRDVNPKNIFITSNEDSQINAKLLDFGLVKVSSGFTNELDLTHDNAIIGTPAYMSPEQAASKPVDIRTDIYSLGAVAYFMLTGEPPFVRYTIVETLNAHIQARHRPLSEIRSDLSYQLTNAIHRCLAKDPNSRFDSMKDLSLALEAAETVRK